MTQPGARAQWSEASNMPAHAQCVDVDTSRLATAAYILTHNGLRQPVCLISRQEADRGENGRLDTDAHVAP
jgi:hypothetical protein